MISFIIGFILGGLVTFLSILFWVIYEYAKAAEQAHRDGYEYPHY